MLRSQTVRRPDRRIYSGVTRSAALGGAASRVALAATRANACCEAGVGPHGSCDPPCLSVARRAGSDGVATMADASAALTLAYDSGGNLTGIDADYGVAINLSLYPGFQHDG